MPDYRAPGVYVEEVPSAIKPIAGVSTSTAGFIGLFGDEKDKGGAKIMLPGDRIAEEEAGKGDGTEKRFALEKYPVIERPGSFAVRVAGTEVTSGISLVNDDKDEVARIVFADAATAPADGKDVTIDYLPGIPVIQGERIVGDWVGTGDSSETEFLLSNYPVLTDRDFKVTVAGRGETRVTLVNDDQLKAAKVQFQRASIPKANEVVTVDYVPLKYLTPPGEVRLCTSFNDFVRSFGGFSVEPNQRRLAHAVYGFFNNGGTRCYVVRETREENISSSALPKLGAIDEIAIVAAPGVTKPEIQLAIENHCRNLGDRFGILDSAEGVTPQTAKPAFNSNYAAVYYPWLQVFDPVTKAMRPTGDGRMYVPPSGHIAGIYARVDAERGVHKAPANEVVMGALGLACTLSKADQAGLNPIGINCIRSINGNIQVWGARTLGGDANADLKYVNVRRTLLFLRKSIEQGTQWVVFEPNGPELWQRITRNITAFLTTVWRSGALFGTTVSEAFYVRCNSETNPPELRDLGQVVTEIGVAIVRPAEFVIFRISQFTAAGA
jgi:phage tail sheath protein FI